MPQFAQMQSELGRASQLLKAMASPNRLMLLCLLADRERSVGALADELGLRQATVSQHLARLRQHGLVATRREAQTVFYSIADDATADVIGVLHAHFCA